MQLKFNFSFFVCEYYYIISVFTKCHFSRNVHDKVVLHEGEVTEVAWGSSKSGVTASSPTWWMTSLFCKQSCCHCSIIWGATSVIQASTCLVRRLEWLELNKLCGQLCEENIYKRKKKGRDMCALILDKREVYMKLGLKLCGVVVPELQRRVCVWGRC